METKGNLEFHLHVIIIRFLPFLSEWCCRNPVQAGDFNKTYILIGIILIYKKDFHDPESHNGVITHLEPDILEHGVQWTLRSITMNKASGADGIPVELFQILKDDVVKVLHSICQQMWKTQQWPQDWKRSVFIAIPKMGNAKECSD